MTEMYEITNSVPLPTTRQPGTGRLLPLLFALEPGQSFACPHYASGSITLIQKTNPERVYTRRREKETGLVRIWRVK
jgi:hypothetical protein